MKFDDVVQAIAEEREYQRQRWGHRMADGSFTEAVHSVEEFIVYMQSYLQEAGHQISREPGNRSALNTLRKVVALGVACFEQHEFPSRDLDNVVNARDNELAMPGLPVEEPLEDFDFLAQPYFDDHPIVDDEADVEDRHGPVPDRIPDWMFQ